MVQKLFFLLFAVLLLVGCEKDASKPIPDRVGVTVAGGNGAGNAADQLYGAYSIALDALGNIYVTDFANHRVQKWAPGATFGLTIAGGKGPGPALDQLNGPSSIGFDKVGNLYVSDYYNKRILQYAPGNTIGKNIIRDNSYIFDIILPDSIEVYLSNAQGNILSYTPRFVGSDGSWLTNTTHVVYLQVPKAIALDAAKNLYIVELNGSSVLKFAPGSQVRTVVAGGNGDGNAANQLNRPEGITIDSAGNLYIADTRNHRVQKWAPGATSGVTVAGGKFGQGPDCLAWPQDVKLDKAGNIYIADVGNNRVQKWPKM